MLPAFLVPETELTHSGSGGVFPFAGSMGLMLVTLGVTRVVEQESLDMTIYASPDGVSWPSKPILVFPQKFYPGTSQLLLDLGSSSDPRFLQPRWKLNRWGRGDLKPLFGVFLFIEEQN